MSFYSPIVKRDVYIYVCADMLFNRSINVCTAIWTRIPNGKKYLVIYECNKIIRSLNVYRNELSLLYWDIYPHMSNIIKRIVSDLLKLYVLVVSDD